jgi:hypothetical protein
MNLSMFGAVATLRGILSFINGVENESFQPRLGSSKL